MSLAPLDRFETRSQVQVHVFVVGHPSPTTTFASNSHVKCSQAFPVLRERTPKNKMGGLGVYYILNANQRTKTREAYERDKAYILIFLKPDVGRTSAIATRCSIIHAHIPSLRTLK